MPADELAVADPLATRSPCDADHAVDDRELIDRRRRAAPTPCCSSASRAVAPACARLRLVEVRRRRLAARRRALIGRRRGVALDQRDAIERHRELLGDQLRLRGVDALTELALAGVGGDAAVGGDRDPRIELPRIDVRRLSVERPLRRRRSRSRRRRAEADDERAGRSSGIAARATRHARSASIASGVIVHFLLRVALDRAQHAGVREAAAQHAGHRLLDFARRSPSGF